MSWISKLYQTHECIQKLDQPQSIWPVSHISKNAHIEIVIDINGNIDLNRIRKLEANEASTIIPSTESSANRTGKLNAPHPLSDEIGYCAADFPGIDSDRYEKYISQLKSWKLSEYSHPKINAIYKYLLKNRLWHDVSDSIEFPFNFKSKSGSTSKIKAEKAFIRWRVEEENNPVSATWEDNSLINAWIEYDNKYNSKNGFCYVTGKSMRIAEKHPRFIRNSGDGGKLISSNDTSGFTFKGRFLNASQAASVGYEITQKAHNTLRWLISRQGYRNGDQSIVSWAVSGKTIPKPLADTFSFLEEGDKNEIEDTNEIMNHSSDLGQTFAVNLRKYMLGFSQKLIPTEDIVIMALDSATPGRMAITYYKEMFAKEYIDKIMKWHIDFAWYQRHKDEKKIIWIPACPNPFDICSACFGANVSDSLKKNIIQRVLPCIVDGKPFPIDLVKLAIKNAVNKNKYSKDNIWLWEKNLGIACSLYKGFCKRQTDSTKRREYTMAIEENNNSRDYLYGRLLAIAEYIEEIALKVADEKRSTTTDRLMQYFAERPYSTWRNIELALQPYKQRLYNQRLGFIVNREKDLDHVFSKFEGSAFVDDSPLSGEFLLAYHVQRLELHKKNNENNKNDNDETN